MSAITDRDLLEQLLDASLSPEECEAFASMAEQVDRGGPLTEKQRAWALDVATKKGLVDEAPLNLASAGKVPKGVVLPKTDGEKKAAEILTRKALAPPGRKVPT